MIPSVKIEWPLQEPIYWRYLYDPICFFFQPMVQGYGSGDMVPMFFLQPMVQGYGGICPHFRLKDGTNVP